MSTHVVIDGYNLIGALERGRAHRDLDGARARLVERVRVYRKARRARVTVVFDGGRSGKLTRGGESIKGVAVIFSRGGEDADTVIKGLCQKEKGLTVVTSDRELRAYCEAQGAVTLSSGQFTALLEAAEYEEVKGAHAEDEEYEPAGGKKKGPSKRPPKEERKKLNRLKKL
jgi:predicted RNA-binding protein with PIN domain